MTSEKAPARVEHRTQRRDILFPGHRVSLVEAEVDADPLGLLDALGVAQPDAVILVCGGASSLDAYMRDHATVYPPLARLFNQMLAPLAASARALVISGGTEAGVMALVGKAVAAHGGGATLLGVAPSGRVTYPGAPDPGPGDVRTPLDPMRISVIVIAQIGHRDHPGRVGAERRARGGRPGRDRSEATLTVWSGPGVDLLPS